MSRHIDRTAGAMSGLVKLHDPFGMRTMIVQSRSFISLLIASIRCPPIVPIRTKNCVTASDSMITTRISFCPDPETMRRLYTDHAMATAPSLQPPETIHDVAQAPQHLRHVVWCIPRTIGPQHFHTRLHDRGRVLQVASLLP